MTTTREVLDFALAHARARDAVHIPLDLRIEGAIYLDSAARNRNEYLRRPDLGRKLKTKLDIEGPFDVVFAIVDGLSSQAVHNHAQAVLNELMPLLSVPSPTRTSPLGVPACEGAVRSTEAWRIAPLMIVRQGRVAIGDEIGSAINAALSVVLIGERPGLSSPDSLGIYLTWNPRPGRTDAERNCISNIHAGGLSPGAAAHLLAVLMRDARARQLSGINLKAPSLLTGS
jgi:ethanolamine ammonia-lyase small subunit